MVPSMTLLVVLLYYRTADYRQLLDMVFVPEDQGPSTPWLAVWIRGFVPIFFSLPVLLRLQTAVVVRFYFYFLHRTSPIPFPLSTNNGTFWAAPCALKAGGHVHPCLYPRIVPLDSYRASDLGGCVGGSHSRSLADCSTGFAYVSDTCVTYSHGCAFRNNGRERTTII